MFVIYMKLICVFVCIHVRALWGRGKFAWKPIEITTYLNTVSNSFIKVPSAQHKTPTVKLCAAHLFADSPERCLKMFLLPTRLFRSSLGVPAPGAKAQVYFLSLRLSFLGISCHQSDTVCGLFIWFCLLIILSEVPPCCAVGHLVPSSESVPWCGCTAAYPLPSCCTFGLLPHLGSTNKVSLNSTQA